ACVQVLQRLTPAFRLGFVMTTEMGFSPDDNGRKAWHSLKQGFGGIYRLLNLTRMGFIPRFYFPLLLKTIH
ncbi:MAG: hypothetical protein AABZ13_08495, partial [Planctomycetota bacterium]